MERILTTHAGSLVRPRRPARFPRRRGERRVVRSGCLRARPGRRRHRRRAAPGRGRNRRHRRRRDGQVRVDHVPLRARQRARAAHGAARRRLASFRRAATARRSRSSTPSTTPPSPARSRTRCRSRLDRTTSVAAEIEPQRNALVLHRPDQLRPLCARARHRPPEACARGRRGGRRVPPVVAPASVYWLRNEYYASEEEFVFAVADALHEEYQAHRRRGLPAPGRRRGAAARVRLDPLARRLDRRLPALGGAARSRRSTMRSRESRRSGSATTSASAAGTARMPSTRRSPTSSTSCCGCARATT